MTDTNLQNDILRKIKEEHITPKPRWEFLLKDAAVWISGIASLVVGGLATSVIIYMTRSDDWEIIAAAGDTPTKTFLLAMPYFWILTLAAFVIIADYNFKHTKKGYRYRIPYVVAGSIIVSAFLGIFFYDAGAGRAIDRAFMERVPMYDHFGHPKVRMWMRPEKGMLAGTVIEVSTSHTFRMQDMEKRVWQIRTMQPLPENLINEPVGIKLRCVGHATGPDMFEAVRVMPMFPPPNPILLRGQ